MELGITVRIMARNTRSSGRLANLARLAVAFSGNKPKSFCWFQFVGFSELDFWMPNCAIDMNPVVTHSPFQRLPWMNRLADSLLSVLVELDGFDYHFLFHPFLLPVTFGFLLMARRLGSFHQLLLCQSNRAHDAFI
jgi:hypothetical protein